MEYFKYTYDGVEYEFKPNRKSQVRIDALQREKRTENPDTMKKAMKIAPKLETYQKELEKKQNELEKASSEEEKEKVESETRKLLEEAGDVFSEAYDVIDVFQERSPEKIMYILLEEQRDADGNKKYPDLNKELFERICNSIEFEYGLEEYNQITEAIVEDVFMTSGKAKKAEPRSSYLRNRNKK